MRSRPRAPFVNGRGPDRRARSFLLRLDANVPRAFAAAVVTLTFAAVVASIVPRGAASVDSMVALRAD